ncbi:erythromycin esterase family protein [Neobacillus cucumis]|uniref:Protein-L-isoaspartate O-methyltransferase n=1 Tax=Neobacillus cucumis TaxID=1740721 RepID=A0A2N5HB68_9BACI|nr:erythromycin esterase family protein [Neobacillus cucumis]PLS02765.1 protein-L-isoaspartate O-methyltransferase [Neobacillus cucumis]
MIDSLKKYAKPFNSVKDLDPLIEAVGEAKYVLLGESSHGTSEYYTIRAELTKRLILEKGFSFIAVEGDWPACQSINRYIKGLSSSAKDSRKVLEGFNRWPTWMWANQEIMGLIEWLKEFNSKTNRTNKIGFYGLDVYSLWESLDEIVGFLEKNNSPELETAKKAYACFEPHNRNNESYAVSAGYLSDDCMKETLELLSTIQKNKWKFEDDQESSLNIEVNALVTAHAEEYYRTMVKSDSDSWNIRDRHMVDALNSIIKFYGNEAKVIIWEHNTHVGDARATNMKDEGMINVGQLVREKYGKDEVFIIGFGTYSGTVIASTEWGVHFEVMNVPPAQTGSWEDLMHQTGAINQYLIFNVHNCKEFSDTIGHRAIGVVYHPEYEHFGNYVPSNMGQRYDGFIFVDRTNALHPIALGPILI